MESIKIHCIDGRETSVSRSMLCKYSPKINFILKPFSNSVSITFYLSYAFENVKIIDEFMKKQKPYFYSLKSAMDVYRISKILKIINLIRYCRNYMIRPVLTLHVCEIYEFACQNTDYDLQFYCWRKFSNDWYTVFYRNKNALDCDETVIRRLVSRPIYQTLEERTIFKIVYEWARRRVNTRTSLRQIMLPFIINIRFLTMDDEFLKGYVYPKQFLTEEEVNAIQHYKATSDNSMIPDSICKRDISRNNEKHSFWFIYCNRSSFFLDQEMNMENKFQFISELFVLEDCFLTGIILPVSHNSEEKIRIRIKNFVHGDGFKINEQREAICHKNGYVNLNQVIYFPKYSTVRVISKFNEDDILRSNIRISNSATRYIQNEEMAISFGKIARLIQDIEYIYCNVKLYF
ncbi:uncharacterized protein LOC111615570 [Centruroides sculpturatus]|uniref:uncharacterized protein LOC111615570 n=1 Tax=Centruroides sculpturatus TaxID=218467 RepID=UPI000C6D59A7|nr:uncharacterized protein LOC111615570 [Centruroides sculpturatus]